MDCKIEIQGLTKIHGQFLTRSYLPSKIQSASWLWSLLQFLLFFRDLLLCCCAAVLLTTLTGNARGNSSFQLFPRFNFIEFLGFHCISSTFTKNWMYSPQFDFLALIQLHFCHWESFQFDSILVPFLSFFFNIFGDYSNFPVESHILLYMTAVASVMNVLSCRNIKSADKKLFLTRQHPLRRLLLLSRTFNGIKWNVLAINLNAFHLELSPAGAAMIKIH